MNWKKKLFDIRRKKRGHVLRNNPKPNYVDIPFALPLFRNACHLAKKFLLSHEGLSFLLQFSLGL